MHFHKDNVASCYRQRITHAFVNESCSNCKKITISELTSPRGNIAPLALCNQLSCQRNVLGPLQGAYEWYPSAFLPKIGYRSLHRRVFELSGEEDLSALPPSGTIAIPELDLEMTAMLSRAAERVGLEWRPPPCSEPSRLLLL